VAPPAQKFVDERPLLIDAILLKESPLLSQPHVCMGQPYAVCFPKSHALFSLYNPCNLIFLKENQLFISPYF
jgi:hypothetical protein